MSRQANFFLFVYPKNKYYVRRVLSADILVVSSAIHKKRTWKITYQIKTIGKNVIKIVHKMAQKK
jgi:hypothetical protein